MNDSDYMKLALDLARQGCGYTSPNPMVGAVVVNQHRVVGRGYHQAAGKAHAEVEALRDAGPDTHGATLYVTLEPCNHTGRTPPCTDAILKAGIRRVVAAMRDPNPAVVGGGIEQLRHKGLTVDVGVCEEEAKRLNEAFIKYIRTKLPFVVLKCAATLDGRIATRTGDAKWITGEASRAFVHEMRHAVDAILVGVGTVKADDPQLTARPVGKTGSDPVRYILDTHLSIPDTAKVLRQDSTASTVVVTGKTSLKRKRTIKMTDRVTVVDLPQKDGCIDLHALMTYLGEKEATSLLIEGGSRVINGALQAGIVDKVLFFYAPKILTGDDGKPICTGTGPSMIKDSLPVSRIRVERFGDDVMIEGYLKCPF